MLRLAACTARKARNEARPISKRLGELPSSILRGLGSHILHMCVDPVLTINGTLLQSSRASAIRTERMMRPTTILAALCVGGLTLLSCSREAPNPRLQGSAAIRLKPVATPLPEPIESRTVYVPVYSSVYLGTDVRQNMVDLAATVSVRNVSSRYPLVLNFVRYYDSDGKQIREYVSSPSELAPLATVEFVIQRDDAAGGPGANFLVQWAGGSEIDEPIIEAVMVGVSGNAGFSFTSPGRTVKKDLPR